MRAKIRTHQVAFLDLTVLCYINKFGRNFSFSLNPKKYLNRALNLDMNLSVKNDELILCIFRFKF